MSPTAIDDNAPIAADPANLKAKLVGNKVELEKAHPPVADNFMYDFKYNHSLPTIDVLGQDIPADVDAQEAAEELLAKLEQALGAGDAAAFTGLFVDYGVWRDKLSFTWDYRTFNFKDAIGRAASDLLPTTKARNLSFLAPSPNIQRPYPDLAYLQFTFSFDTDLVNGSAVVNAIHTKEGWKLWTFYSSIESLLQFPPVPPADGHMIGTTSFEKQRAKFIDEVQPDVLVIGGGQNGLAMSAHLKNLGVSNLIIERDSKVGGVWIDRYEYLSLHAPHYADHLPFMDLPKMWPVYTPAQKFGRFFQSYVDQLDLPIWLSSQVTRAEQDEAGNWTVEISKAGETRTLRPKHVVMATSLCGMPTTPVIPGMADWQGGVYRHSSKHDSSKEFVGKKVLVVGTSSSAFDTAYEAARLGIDVTLLQRSPTYVMSLEHSMPRILGNYWPDKEGNRPDLDVADRLSMSMPNGPAEEFGRRQAKVLEDLDKDLLEGLHAKGFKTWRGQRDTGNSTLGQTRNGGFYFEAGACQQIIDGKIKVEQGFIERFTQDKVILSGGRETHYDLIVFATGFSNTIDSVRATLGEKIASQCGPIWGIDEEGEIKTAYKETGVPNMWLMLGYLPMTRYHSKRLALRIKALLEGIAPAPYKA